MSDEPTQAPTNTVQCPLCGQIRSTAELVPGILVRPAVLQLIQTEHPQWDPDQQLCLADLHRYRLSYLQTLLASRKGELSALDKEVIESLHHNELLSENIAESVSQGLSLGARVADRVAAFGGSWPFIGLFGAIILGWIGVNGLWLARRAFDPYPFILLNLVLSCLAAVQAPVIMMSQNRQAARDRAHAEHDYQVNLKAELEIRMLHEKLDHLLLNNWQRLMDVQAIQADLMDELSTRLDAMKR
ncbi:MAG: DUF1003 domain-containing protein [Gemmatimonadota bacterium]